MSEPEPVPAIELNCLGGELHQALVGEPGEHGAEGLLLAHARLEGVLALEARGDPERLAAVIAEARERAEQELLVRDRLADLERRVPCGEHRQVVVVELVHRLGVVDLELVVGDLVDPRAHDLAEQLAAGLTPDALRYDPDRFLRLDEAQWHVRQIRTGSRRKDAMSSSGSWTHSAARPGQSAHSEKCGSAEGSKRPSTTPFARPSSSRSSASASADS